MVDDAAQSMLGTLQLDRPHLRPGLWLLAGGVALLTGLIAKEMVVSSLSMFYGFALTATSAQVAAAMTGFTPCPPSPCWCSSCRTSHAWRRYPPWPGR